MPPSFIQDVAVIPPADGADKQTLVQAYRDSFTTKPLYKKLVPRQRFVPLLPAPDTLINTGYFITKATLDSLTAAIGAHPDGGVWIDFAMGRAPGRGFELQLVLTATETDAELSPTDTGKLCVATGQAGNRTDPPYTGNGSPRG